MINLYRAAAADDALVVVLAHVFAVVIVAFLLFAAVVTAIQSHTKKVTQRIVVHEPAKPANLLYYPPPCKPATVDHVDAKEILWVCGNGGVYRAVL